MLTFEEPTRSMKRAIPRLALNAQRVAHEREHIDHLDVFIERKVRLERGAAGYEDATHARVEIVVSVSGAVG